jgi:peroxiredoxin Q/BCP
MLRTFLRRLLSKEPNAMLATGTPAPAFEAPDHTGATVKLSDFQGKRVILWFYPKADTPG